VKDSARILSSKVFLRKTSAASICRRIMANHGKAIIMRALGRATKEKSSVVDGVCQRVSNNNDILEGSYLGDFRVAISHRASWRNSMAHVRHLQGRKASEGTSRLPRAHLSSGGAWRNYNGGRIDSGDARGRRRHQAIAGEGRDAIFVATNRPDKRRRRI